MMNVLVACEESQEVCKAFREKGHRAFSCDLQECSGGHPEWHIPGDVLPLLNGNCTFQTADSHTHTQDGRWDLIIAHPPCTDLAVSGARWFPEKQKDFRQQKACVFFMQMALAECDRVAVENPIGIMSSCYRKPDQIIQPYEYGHHIRKSTWFTDGGALQMARDENGKIISWNDPRTAKIRSKTFPGIAKAMAEQWG